MFINLILIVITILCISLVFTIRLSCNCIDKMDNTVPLYLDKPTKLFESYFPYIDITYINNKIINPYTTPNIINNSTSSIQNGINIDLWLQRIPDYETKLFDILTDKKYDNIYKGIFDIKPEYNTSYNIFYAYMLNRKNSTLKKETDIQNKYIIKKLFDDINYLYIIPFAEKITDVIDLPVITNYNMIDTACIKDNKYIQCKIKLTSDPKNFQVIEDKYYQDIVDYYTSLIFVDIINIMPINDKCNIIIPMEEDRQKKFRERLQTVFIDILPPIITTTSSVTTCNCGKS